MVVILVLKLKPPFYSKKKLKQKQQNSFFFCLSYDFQLLDHIHICLLCVDKAINITRAMVILGERLQKKVRMWGSSYGYLGWEVEKESKNGGLSIINLLENNLKWPMFLDGVVFTTIEKKKGTIIVNNLEKNWSLKES